MTAGDAADDVGLLAEQVAYYRARAPEYLDTATLDNGESVSTEQRLVAVIDGFAASGDVLELACGPGTWTPRLLRGAATLTAVDASPEMLAIAASSVPSGSVEFVRADLFQWRPQRRYDAVFFGFWLSHVPMARFDGFWKLVADCLKPGGRVMFVDDALRTEDELVEGAESSVIRRRLNDGREYRAVKVPHRPDELRERLAALGWDIEVSSAGPFFYGCGGVA